MKKLWIILGLVLTGWVQAQEVTIPDSVPDKYTFGDFFDAIELPAMFGVGFSPYGLEGVSFCTTVRVGWRHHKVFGTFAGLVYENHIHTYEDLDILETNIKTGDIVYNEVGFFVGYRIPLVRDIRAFYQRPYHVPCNVYLSVRPTLTIPNVMHVTMEEGASKYDVTHANVGLVPSMKFNLGFEWFIVERFSLSAEVGYLQHCMPTALEQAAIAAGRIHTPAGQMNVGLALSVLFK